MAESKKVKINGIEKQILNQLPTPVMAVDNDFCVTYLNDTGCKLLEKTFKQIEGKYCYDLFNSDHCRSEKCCMRKAMDDGKKHNDRNFFEKNDQITHIEYHTSPLNDEKGNLVGGLEYILDITTMVEDEERLYKQDKTIRELSTPTIKLWDGILVLPVVGIIDSNRAQYMMDSMLTKILESSSKVIILDIHGVAAVDTAVANHIIKITKATKLMGCECLLSGISPAVAQTIIQLGIDMGDVNTHSTLSDALKSAFEMIKLTVESESR
jgi:rsbT co-antagonist protein RsbR